MSAFSKCYEHDLQTTPQSCQGCFVNAGMEKVPFVSDSRTVVGDIQQPWESEKTHGYFDATIRNSKFASVVG